MKYRVLRPHAMIMTAFLVCFIAMQAPLPQRAQANIVGMISLFYCDIVGFVPQEDEAVRRKSIKQVQGARSIEQAQGLD